MHAPTTRADARVPDRLISPLDVLLDEHRFQAGICGILERVAHNPRHGASPAELGSVLEYMARGLELHMEDEEDDLLPALVRRHPEPAQMEEIAARVKDQHDADGRLAMTILVDLERLTGGRAMREPVRFFRDAVSLCRDMRGHVAWENEVVMPLARRHLAREDLVIIGRSMMARRDAVHHAKPSHLVRSAASA